MCKKNRRKLFLLAHDWMEADLSKEIWPVRFAREFSLSSVNMVKMHLCKVYPILCKESKTKLYFCWHMYQEGQQSFNFIHLAK